MIFGMVAGILIAAGVSLFVGLRENRHISRLHDILPVARDGEASIRSAIEFSTSTTATTVSLATVILAYFELSPYLGPWLFWTVITTAAGIVTVRVAAPVILDRVSVYGNRVPSLHEFLGTEFGSGRLKFVAALCTCLGFLGAIAVELTVGARFIAQFFPGASPTLLVVALAAVGLGYTALGGFRAVIVTDRVQMVGIWLMAIVLTVLYTMFFVSHPQARPLALHAITNFSPREGLTAFLIGILVINVPTFLADMSMWQRIGGTRERENATKGLLRSAGGVSAIWGILCVLAVSGPIVAGAQRGDNALVGVLVNFREWLPRPAVPIAIGLVATGLLCAMFSTASTQLIAFVHAAYEDVLRTLYPPLSQAGTAGVRLVLLFTAGAGVLIVEGMMRAGLSIADLVFGVYGSQLGLVPAVCLALFVKRDRLQGLGGWGLAAVSVAFPVGWGMAVVGRVSANPNLTFLAPVGSLAIAMATLGIGIGVKGWRKQ